MGWFPLFSSRSQGRWKTGAARLADINAVVRDCGSQAGFANASSLGTQSAKATLLSYRAKYGLSAECRAALGYHKTAQITSAALSYSRDRLRSRSGLSTTCFQASAMATSIRITKGPQRQRREWIPLLILMIVSLVNRVPRPWKLMPPCN